MSQVTDHYDHLLAEHYTWMIGGDLEKAAAGSADRLRYLGATPEATTVDSPAGTAVDLGCGPGAQVLALADLGFDRAIGVDTSTQLLDELMTHASGREAVHAVNADLVDALPDVLDGEQADVILCMGDTVPHLPDHDAVTSLFTRASSSLTPGGKLVLTYRDLTQPHNGDDRFIPVRSDGDRIMTCFLEDLNADTVMVTDLVHLRTGDRWHLHKSSYPKLRLSPDWIHDQLESAGLAVTHHQQAESGLWTTVSRK
ncbi:MAG TPA: class I SAM-dependent methyltransferase [Candidatus Corynebacterium avicola]|uniref:Class I SAM-dependent methyltransferase n=1 Tax=Candidatus Corynebacterium avicola TaxID=2838527 RepID=A0A9D1RQN7_9CORY|nr:class I SAM-dependent methyltransferase [Candidatus Corynebacterium avicola]